MDNVETFLYYHDDETALIEVVRLSDYKKVIAKAIENYEQLRSQSGSYLEQRVRAEKAERELFSRE